MGPRRSTRSLVATLIGEALREAAVLIAVFTPLDFFVQARPLTVSFLVPTIVGVVTVFGAGVFLEVKYR